MSSKTIKVLLVDDHKIFRQGLRALLEPESDIEIVGESSSGEDAVELANTLQPHIIVMDITMPGLNGLQATNLIKSQNPEIGILVLSMSGDEESIDQAIQAGVNGYLVKETAASELLAAIREVKKGNAFFSPSVSKILLERERNASDRLTPDSLTYREKVIIQLVADGKTTKEIGSVLSISPKTVDKHRQQIMEKLDIHDIASLTRYAISKGIVR